MLKISTSSVEISLFKYFHELGEHSISFNLFTKPIVKIFMFGLLVPNFLIKL